MEQVKHTPGKWERSGTTVYALNDSGTNRMTIHVNGGFVGSGRERTSDGEVEAVARLAQASPDLYAAARRALAVLKAQGESVRPGSVLGALDAAIAKADGRTP